MLTQGQLLVLAADTIDRPGRGRDRVELMEFAMRINAILTSDANSLVLAECDLAEFDGAIGTEAETETETVNARGSR